MFVSSALSLTLLAQAVAAVSQTCDYLKANTKVLVETDRFAIPKAPYSAELDEYWSKASADLKPSCIVYPTSAEEASQAIRALSIDGNNEAFAIKSGGLSANDGFNSVKDGPLISTRRLTGVRYDADKGFVRVATGNRWTEVQKQLDPFNVTVAGARVGEVGVGGYMSGGEFCLMSALLTEEHGTEGNYANSSHQGVSHSTAHAMAGESTHSPVWRLFLPTELSSPHPRRSTPIFSQLSRAAPIILAW